MVKRLSLFLAAFLFSAIGAMAQMQVSGTVVSQDDGEPVVGATVMVVGTNVGTATNVDGKFTLTCPKGHELLRISYVGMEPIEVTARPNMRILLTSDQSALDEVIVIGYGTSKKSAFTGSAVPTHWLVRLLVSLPPRRQVRLEALPRFAFVVLVLTQQVPHRFILWTACPRS